MGESRKSFFPMSPLSSAQPLLLPIDSGPLLQRRETAPVGKEDPTMFAGVRESISHGGKRGRRTFVLVHTVYCTTARQNSLGYRKEEEGGANSFLLFSLAIIFHTLFFLAASA